MTTSLKDSKRDRGSREIERKIGREKERETGKGEKETEGVREIKIKRETGMEERESAMGERTIERETGAVE